MEKVPQNTDSQIDEEISRIENSIRELFPTEKLVELFGKDTYLIGGAVRDIVLGKNPSDLDLMSRMSVDDIRKNLKNAGFVELDQQKDGKFVSGGYSFKKEVNIFNLIIDGKEVQVASIGEKDVSELLSTADLNLSCCAFDLGSSRILDRNFVAEVANKEMRFMNLELAKKDPMKIISALKQISRIPELKIEAQTMEVIRDSIPMVVKFFVDNPDRRHKLKPLFGNINSGQVLDMFEGFDTGNIFDGINRKKSKLNISDYYFSSTVEELSLDIKDKLASFVATQFGKRFDSSKLFNEKVNSVVYEVNEDGDIASCCLLDGERVYATSAISSEKIVKLVSDLCKNNYNVWSTIAITSTHLINLCPGAGLHVVEDPVLAEKILVNNYPKYKGQLIFEYKRGHLVFSKKDSDDKPQVLVKS